MLATHVLFFALQPSDGLPPAAAEHNTAAMRHYDNGELAPAADEFHAAYQAMPDARRDLAGRELLLGSMRATLLELHQQTGRPAPLCRLQQILQQHADALAVAFPEDPERLEIRSARARHDEVTRQLADQDPGACNPAAPATPAPAQAPTPTVASEPPPAPGPAPEPAPPTPDGIPPRHLNIAGGVTLGLSAALIGVMTYGIVAEAHQRARITEIRDECPDCPLSTAATAELETIRSAAQMDRRLAIGAGIAAVVTATFGGVLLGLARRAAPKRWSAAPWGSPTSAGLTVRVHLGASTQHR